MWNWFTVWEYPYKWDAVAIQMELKELKNATARNNRILHVNSHTSELEHKLKANNDNEMTKQSKSERMERNVRCLRDSSQWKMPFMDYRNVRGEGRKNGKEQLVKEMMSQNFPSLRKAVSVQNKMPPKNKIEGSNDGILWKALILQYDWLGFDPQHSTGWNLAGAIPEHRMRGTPWT